MRSAEEEFEALSNKLGAETIDITKREEAGMKIILIGHKKRQGKDAFSQSLKKYLDVRDIKTAHLSFAYPMKKIIAEAVGVNMTTLDHMKNGSDHYRAMLQKFGSGLMKQYFGDTVWRDLALKEIDKLEKDGFDCVIISDFRFPCEYIDGALTINIDRDGGNGDAHISETALDGFEYKVIVENKGTLEELDAKAKSIAENVSKGFAWV